MAKKKITKEIALEIWRLYVLENETQNSISAKMNISQTSISRLLLGKDNLSLGIPILTKNYRSLHPPKRILARELYLNGLPTYKISKLIKSNMRDVCAWTLDLRGTWRTK